MLRLKKKVSAMCGGLAFQSRADIPRRRCLSRASASLGYLEHGVLARAASSGPQTVAIPVAAAAGVARRTKVDAHRRRCDLSRRRRARQVKNCIVKTSGIINSNIVIILRLRRIDRAGAVDGDRSKIRA